MHPGIMSRRKAHSFFPLWVRQRELRQRLPLGHSDAFCKNLYSSISLCHSWGGGETSGSEHGGLYSLEFSPDGSLLVAGCKKNGFLVFDPLSRRLINTVHNAHANGVKHIKFLDAHIFATGSVDETVSLWDTRNLKSRCGRLTGHSRMIGSIEFSRKNDLLITSGLDGCLCIWDMKNWNEKREFCKNVFESFILLRMRLNPDESKMIIATESGSILIVHELDLNTFAEDLQEFVQDLLEYRSFKSSLARPTADSGISRLLSPNCRRNRVELVGDFPYPVGFNMISALEIHPQGWSALSRSTCTASGEEWICVHDIQDKDKDKDKDKERAEGDYAARGESWDKHTELHQQDDARRVKRHGTKRINEVQYDPREDERGTSSLGRQRRRFFMPFMNNVDFELPVAAFSLQRGLRERRAASPADSGLTRDHLPRPTYSLPTPIELSCPGCNPAFRCLLLPRPNSRAPQSNREINEPFERLTHYIEESNSSDWCVENLSVSADGRLVCSPFDRGVRLLAFSPECSEQSVSWCGTKPRRLHVLSTHNVHNNYVLSTKFSPRHCLLVSGCSGGKLAWYQPVV